MPRGVGGQIPHPRDSLPAAADQAAAVAAPRLYDGDREVAKFTVEGKAGQPDELAAGIAAEVEKRLAGRAGK